MTTKQLVGIALWGLAVASSLCAQEGFSEDELRILQKGAGGALARRLMGGAQPRRAVAQRTSSRVIGNNSIDSRDIVLPLVMNGKYGTSKIATAVEFINTTANPVYVIIEFFDAGGRAATLPVATGDGKLDGRYSEMDGVMGGESVSGLMTYPEGLDVRVLYARIQTDAPPDAIRVVVGNYRFAGTSTISSGGLVVSPGRQNYFSVEENDLTSKFFIVNTSPDPVTATLRALDRDGKEICRSYATIDAGEMLVVNPGTRDSCMRKATVDAHLFVVGSDQPVLAVGNYFLTSTYFSESPGVPGN